MSIHKLLVVPVGASGDWFAASENKTEKGNDPLHVLFYGTYIPLHGVEVILRAAALVKDLPLQFELIGSGQEYERGRALAESLALPNVSFEQRVPLSELIERVKRADICLGIFGSTPKATRVIPNKVYECAALGKPIITADTPAIREVFTPDEDVVLCAATPESLAAAIRALAVDSGPREFLGEHACGIMAQSYTPERIVSRLLVSLIV